MVRVFKRDVRGPDPADPLAFILFEHLKHREMCNALDRLAELAEFDEAETAALADFVGADLALHISDEEEVFFPMLRKRCAPEDEIETVLARLDREHEADRDLALRVRQILLTAASEGRPPSATAGASEALKAFAHNQRRHMMLENGVLIPLARRRFTAADLAILGRRFAAAREN